MFIAFAHALAAAPSLLFGLLALVSCLAGAQTPQTTDAAAGFEQQVRRLALDSVHAGAPGMPRVEVSVGQLDPRLRLAPCLRMEPYLPEGTRLWGKTRIGLRCIQGTTKWNVYLPVTVRFFAKALVAATGAPAGAVLSASDLTLAEVDLAEDASVALQNADIAIGRVLAHPLKPGQTLRQSHLKARQWFAAGDTVTVLARGSGFSVAGEAQALNPGIEGQAIRVRTESGRVLTGQAVGERRVELAL